MNAITDGVLFALPDALPEHSEEYGLKRNASIYEDEADASTSLENMGLKDASIYEDDERDASTSWVRNGQHKAAQIGVSLQAFLLILNLFMPSDTL